MSTGQSREYKQLDQEFQILRINRQLYPISVLSVLLGQLHTAKNDDYCLNDDNTKIPSLTHVPQYEVYLGNYQSWQHILRKSWSVIVLPATEM